MINGSTGDESNGTGFLARVDRAVDQLPDDERIPWELYYRCGLDLEQVAEAMNCGRIDMARRLYCATFMIGLISSLNPKALRKRLKGLRPIRETVALPDSITAHAIFGKICTEE